MYEFNSGDIIFNPAVYVIIPENGAGEGGRVEAQGPPHLQEGGHQQPEREDPHPCYHQHDIAPVQ